MQLLSEEDRTHFSRDIIEVARGCAGVHDFGPFLIELAEWHATAKAVAAGYTAPGDLGWLDEPTPATGTGFA